ncbi:MaoC/PaaZ C-terminal domain-containing protein [Streptomyces sp. NBC_00669]|uniref:MaoC/PaaZ C-terminal domain-containing protein n=1 Tax=unclassified Streptomyces TaxID=2593676 RepID=UPI002E35B3DC|nr:MaoC/PaaZ C-terminal domain-containing protein [Streptomyces sp. NBC_00669]
MALLLTLGRGALTGIGKKPSAGAALPHRRLTEPDVRIDPARMARYAEVCGYSPAADRVPLTYPHILGFPLAARIMAARDFPLPLMGLVHTSIEIAARRPLTSRDRPEIAVHAEELRPHRRGTEVVFVTEALLGGEPVWTDRSTYLARHATGRPQEPRADRAPEAELPAVEEWRLPADLGRRHARVSGDYNPIHLHAWTARPLGFPRAIAHGMWTVARSVAALGLSETVRAEFRAPVPLPSTVTFAASGPRFEVRSRRGLHVSGAS